MPSWVVGEWNGHESNHFFSLCQVTWGFAISFRNKPFLAPHLILSDRSICICPHQGIIIAFLHPTSRNGLCGARGRYERQGILASHILQNQRLDPGEKQFTQSDQDVHVYGYERYGRVYTKPEMGSSYYHHNGLPYMMKY
jgi:hypothetical protein